MNKLRWWRKRFLLILMLLGLVVTFAGFLAPWMSVGILPEVQLISTFLPFLLPVWLFFLWRAAKLSAKKLIVLPIIGVLLSSWVALKDVQFFGPTIEKAPQVRVLSFNVGTFDFNKNNIHEVGKLVKEWNPDVVVMQEFRNQGAGNGEKALEYLSSLWDMPHYDFLHLPYHVHGAAFFSRFEIKDVDTLFLPREEINSGILITVETSEGPLGIANVHFSSFHMRAIYESEPDLERKVRGIYGRAKKTLGLQQEKVEAVLNKLKEYPHPVIIAGDFNATPHSSITYQVNRYFQDSFEAVGKGRGYTFQVLGPLGIRIDYQFASPNLQPVSHQVIRRKISDHYPLIVGYHLSP